MNRKISILLTVLVLTSSIGLTLEKHYCEGKLIDIFLLPHFGETCDSNIPMDQGSCKNETIKLLIENPKELITTKVNLARSFVWLDIIEVCLVVDIYEYNNKNQKTTSLPPITYPKIFLRVGSFLI